MVDFIYFAELLMFAYMCTKQKYDNINPRFNKAHFSKHFKQELVNIILSNYNNSSFGLLVVRSSKNEYVKTAITRRYTYQFIWILSNADKYWRFLKKMFKLNKLNVYFFETSDMTPIPNELTIIKYLSKHTKLNELQLCDIPVLGGPKSLDSLSQQTLKQKYCEQVEQNI